MKNRTHNGWRILMFVIAIALLSSFTYATSTGTLIHFNIADQDAPTVTLDSPAEGYNSSSDSVTFSWIAADDTDSSMMCNITMNGMVRANNIASPNNTLTSANVGGLTSGTYDWNVTCWDDYNNMDTSATRNLTLNVTAPPISPPSGRGGGGGRGIAPDAETCEEDWTCSPWTPCTNNMQTRSCYDINSCGTIVDKPRKQRICVPEETYADIAEDDGQGNATEGGRGLALLDPELLKQRLPEPEETDTYEKYAARDMITGQAIVQDIYGTAYQIFMLPSILLLALIIALLMFTLDIPKWKRRQRAAKRAERKKAKAIPRRKQ